MPDPTAPPPADATPPPADATPPQPDAAPPQAGAEPVEIIDHTFSGHGLALIEGAPVQVPGTLVGERVRLGPVERIRGRLWAYPQQIHTASPHRVDPACAQYDHCAGCSLRHVEAAAALQLKARKHLETLLRLYPAAAEVRPQSLAAPQRDHHRHRLNARGSLDAQGRLRLGIGKLPGLEGLTDLSHCPAQQPETTAALRRVEAALRELGVRPAEAPLWRGLRHVAIQRHDAGLQLILGFGGEPEYSPSDDTLRAAILPERADLSLYTERFGRRAYPVGSALVHLRGPEVAWLHVEADRLRATPPAWIPQSPDGLPQLRALVLQMLQVGPEDHILEVGCGVGTLSLPLARRAGRLLGIDQCRQAVADAQENAQRSGLTNVQFQAGRAERSLRRLVSARQRADLVILHAMRSPYGPQVLSAAQLLRPRRILLIEPSAAALAQDLADAPQYALRQLAFVDQLPGTAVCLSLACLEPHASGGERVAEHL